jgi:hypothetical protein
VATGKIILLIVPHTDGIVGSKSLGAIHFSGSNLEVENAGSKSLG